MAIKVKAYKVSEDSIKKNKVPSFNELMDNVSNISPVKIRNVGGWNYHVVEDVKGNVFLLDDQLVYDYKLYSRNLGVSETPYLLDLVGKNEIKERKTKPLQKEINNVSFNSDVVSEPIKKVQTKLKNKKTKEILNVERN